MFVGAMLNTTGWFYTGVSVDILGKTGLCTSLDGSVLFMVKISVVTFGDEQNAVV
jgi:hypothetical protein